MKLNHYTCAQKIDATLNELKNDSMQMQELTQNNCEIIRMKK